MRPIRLKKKLECFVPLFYIIIYGFVVEFFTAACIKRGEGIYGLAIAMSTLKTSSGEMICTSGDNSVLSTPECTSRRKRPKPSSILPALLIAPNIDIVRPNNESMMVDWAVLQICREVVMCRQLCFTRPSTCAS